MTHDFSIEKHRRFVFFTLTNDYYAAELRRTQRGTHCVHSSTIHRQLVA
jgi:hypothetical protein